MAKLIGQCDDYTFKIIITFASDDEGLHHCPAFDTVVEF